MKKNIDHIALQVNNIKESVDWYVENYGCSIKGISLSEEQIKFCQDKKQNSKLYISINTIGFT